MTATALHDCLLSDALGYRERDWSVIPIGKNKKPLDQWKRFQTRRAGEGELRDMFTRRGISGVAVIAGEVSGGLAIRDFDTSAGYDQWRDSHHALARSLPTVRTRRGYHVWHRSDRPIIIKLGDGEYRGAGYSIAPHSLRSDGKKYEWINPLPAGEIPLVDSALFVPTNVSESSECHFSDVSELSELSETFSPHDAVLKTLPKNAGERNLKVMDLARGLRLNCGMELVAAKEHVRQWHRMALAVITTKDFDITWADFLHAWERVKYPLGLNLVDAAASKVDPMNLPKAAMNYEGAAQRMTALCAAIASMNGGKFFLSSHDAAKRLGITQTQCWRLLQMLRHDGVIELVEKGNQRRASRYRWIGGRVEIMDVVAGRNSNR